MVLIEHHPHSHTCDAYDLQLINLMESDGSVSSDKTGSGRTNALGVPPPTCPRLPRSNNYSRFCTAPLPPNPSLCIAANASAWSSALLSSLFLISSSPP